MVLDEARMIAAGEPGSRNAIPRLIAHVDMDAFYASVELLSRPELRDLPVVIGGRGHSGKTLAEYAGRGVITTATYAARKFGLHSGMGLMKAAQLCPQAILLPVNFDEYRRYSRQFKAIIRAHAPQVEDRGIDEVYVDFTAVPGAAADGGRVLALRIQDEIHAATGLTCSIGVAPNKLLAKLASEMQKPRGITLLTTDDLAAQVWPLACRKVNGIGPKASERLATLGIHTIGDLAARPLADLVDEFGAHQAEWLHTIAWGRDERPVVTESEPVSISRETTFERDLHAVCDRAQLGTIFTALCRQLAADLQRKGYAGRNVGIKLRYDDFRSITRAVTLPQPIDDAAAIRRAAGQCLKRAPLERRLRLLGVRVGALSHRHGLQVQEPAAGESLSLFE
jgi:DNA polymerase IV